MILLYAPLTSTAKECNNTKEKQKYHISAFLFESKLKIEIKNEYEYFQHRHQFVRNRKKLRNGVKNKNPV